MLWASLLMTIGMSGSGDWLLRGRERMGAVAVAVLTKLPLAAGEIAQLAVCVTLPPAGKLTVSLILPAPAAVHVPPPAPTHVQVHVRVAGNVSLTVAPGALLGPALLVVIV